MLGLVSGVAWQSYMFIVFRFEFYLSIFTVSFELQKVHFNRDVPGKQLWRVWNHAARLVRNFAAEMILCCKRHVVHTWPCVMHHQVGLAPSKITPLWNRYNSTIRLTPPPSTGKSEIILQTKGTSKSPTEIQLSAISFVTKEKLC